jgi:hypothetical protein
MDPVIVPSFYRGVTEVEKGGSFRQERALVPAAALFQPCLAEK